MPLSRLYLGVHSIDQVKENIIIYYMYYYITYNNNDNTIYIVL